MSRPQPASRSASPSCRRAWDSSSFRDIGMTSGNSISPRMKDEGFSLVIVVLLNFTNKNDVVTAIRWANIAADELGDRAVKKRHPSGSFLKFDSSKLVGQRSGELTRKVVLSRNQNVHREVSGVGEINEAGSLSRKTPEDQRRIQRHGRKRVDGHAHLAPVGGAGCHHRHTRGEPTKRLPIIAPLEPLGHCLGFLLHERFRLSCIYEPGE